MSETDTQSNLDVLQQWADGKATLKDVRAYSNEELYSVALMAHLFFTQGKIEEARTLYHGLFAIDPANGEYARALGVVELALNNPQGAVAAYDVAVRINQKDAVAYVGRAEAKIVLKQVKEAVDDLQKANQVVDEGTNSALAGKILALLSALKTR